MSSDEHTGPASRICFVVMPFGRPFDDCYQHVYAPAVRKAGLVPARADDLFASRPIIQDIWDLILKAEIVLADLTGMKPNVYYELGLAHSKGRPVVIVTDNTGEVPFDLRHLRLTPYDRNLHNWGELLRDAVVAAIEETLRDPSKAVPPPFRRRRPPESRRSFPSEDYNRGREAIAKENKTLSDCTPPQSLAMLRQRIQDEAEGLVDEPEFAEIKRKLGGPLAVPFVRLLIEHNLDKARDYLTRACSRGTEQAERLMRVGIDAIKYLNENVGSLKTPVSSRKIG